MLFLSWNRFFLFAFSFCSGCRLPQKSGSFWCWNCGFTYVTILKKTRKASLIGNVGECVDGFIHVKCVSLFRIWWVASDAVLFGTRTEIWTNAEASHNLHGVRSFAWRIVLSVNEYTCTTHIERSTVCDLWTFSTTKNFDCMFYAVATPHYLSFIALSLRKCLRMKIEGIHVGCELVENEIFWSFHA